MTSSLIRDRVTEYAVAVTTGQVMAGPHVRGQCRRHMRDLAAGRWLFDHQKSDRAIRFFEKVLRLDNPDANAEDKSVPFLLIDWQAFVIGSLFGWVGTDGYRRFRVAYIETGKGSGKSPLAAGVGLYGLFADGERRAEIYAGARTRDQAQILFRDAVAMVKLSNVLLSRARFSGGEGREWNIAFLETSSFFRPISSEDGKSGPRPNIGLLDEIHEHPDQTMVELMRAGTKNRRQALIFMITNSGSDRTSVCWDYHEAGSRVNTDPDDPMHIQDESLFAYICANDPGEDPFKDKTIWMKTNPSLGITIQERYLEEQVVAARGMPSKAGIVRRLNFCTWTDAVSEWIDRESFDACQMDADEFDSIDKTGMDRYGGLDLSQKRDLTSYSEVYYDEFSKIMYVESFFWTPSDTMDERAKTDKVPYRLWSEQGHILLSRGKIIAKDEVAQFLWDRFNSDQLGPLRGIAYDNPQMDDLVKEFERAGFDCWIDEEPDGEPGIGIRLVRHGQGFAGFNSDKVMWMPRSIMNLEEAIINQRIRFKKNPVFRWNSASAVTVEDATGNRKWDKNKSKGRIDGVIGATQAVGICQASIEMVDDAEGFFNREPMVF